MTTPPPSLSLLPNPDQTPAHAALQRKLYGDASATERRTWGPLEALALRVGAVQQTQRPRLFKPQLLVFAADHGLALDLFSPQQVASPPVLDLLNERSILPALGHQLGMPVTIVDAGLAQNLPQQPGVLTRKIAHGTRNARLGPAMSEPQLQAAVRAGMEIAQQLPGNVVALSARGAGADESAALVLSRLCGLPSTHWAGASGSHAGSEIAAVLQTISARHADIDDPAELAAAMGGHDLAMMVGVILEAARRQHLILIDGLTACAAVLVAEHIAGPTVPYCVFCRSNPRVSYDPFLKQQQGTLSPCLNVDADDGTGAALAWPMLQSAVALLSALPDVSCDA